MTKELAIRILSTRDKYGVPCGYTSGYEEALDMAIESLEHTPNAHPTHECVEPTHECVDLISRRAALDALEWKWAGKAAIDAIKNLPSAQPEPISEEYAKAVRTWLIDYQVRCAELKGKYTPYEILGWIVSDWRKENEIW